MEKTICLFDANRICIDRDIADNDKLCRVCSHGYFDGKHDGFNEGWRICKEWLEDDSD